MRILLMRFMYLVYFLGVGLIVYHALSEAIFSNGRLRARMAKLGKAVVFSLIWPLAVFSKRGRAKLLHFANVI